MFVCKHPLEGELNEEFTANNRDIAKLPPITQKLFKIFASFSVDTVPYGVWVSHFWKGPDEGNPTSSYSRSP